MLVIRHSEFIPSLSPIDAYHKAYIQLQLLILTFMTSTLLYV